MVCELCPALGSADVLATPPADQSCLAFLAQTVAAVEHGAQLLVPRCEQIVSGGDSVPAIGEHDDEAIHGAFPDAFA